MKKIYGIVSLLLLPCFLIAQAYNFYAGNIHAHTGFSDGNKDQATTGKKEPSDAYAFAKGSKSFNFLGISEHNHFTSTRNPGMRLANYKKGLDQAKKANKDNQFVCLYGMEFGVISNGGHVLIYGVDGLIGWEKDNFDIECPKSDYKTLWTILADYPKAFATLAHPENTDFQNLLNGPYNKDADKALCGVCIMSGPAFAENTDYSSKPAKSTVDYFRKMLAIGYHVGPTIDHDNHYLTFGRMASSRTIVLAKSLSRDNIMDAYREMRFYASTDFNIQVNFTVNGFPMGMRINTKTSADIKVSITDPDAGDKIAAIQLMYGEPGSKQVSTVLKKVTNSNSLTFKHDLPKGKEYYYYLEITQQDGDKVYTSPVWVHRVGN